MINFSVLCTFLISKFLHQIDIILNQNHISVCVANAYLTHIPMWR